jgi:type II secretory pathway predicted ATPase ExeA
MDRRMGPTGEGGDHGPKCPTEGLLGVMGETADPAFYVPRPASERVLLALEAGVCSRSRSAALIAPAGMGKSLLLRVLAERLQPNMRALYLPYASMSLTELCAWGIGLMEGRAPDGGRATPDELVESAGWPARELVLLVDDANSMPLTTARDLGEALSLPRAGARVVLAASDDARMSRVIAALDLDVETCRYSQPFTAEETTAYVDAQLRAAAAEPAVFERFDASTLEQIHGISGGIPRLIHHLAADIVSGQTSRPAWDAIEEDRVAFNPAADAAGLESADSQGDIG